LGNFVADSAAFRHFPTLSDTFRHFPTLSDKSCFFLLFRCRSLRFLLFRCRSLRFLLFRCRSLRFLLFFLQNILKDLLIPYYIFQRDTVTHKTFTGRGGTAHSNSQKVAESSKVCAKFPGSSFTFQFYAERSFTFHARFTSAFYDDCRSNVLRFTIFSPKFTPTDSRHCPSQATFRRLSAPNSATKKQTATCLGYG
jgi:hypothetical protein